MGILLDGEPCLFFPLILGPICSRFDSTASVGSSCFTAPGQLVRTAALNSAPISASPCFFTPACNMDCVITLEREGPNREVVKSDIV